MVIYASSASHWGNPPMPPIVDLSEILLDVRSTAVHRGPGRACAVGIFDMAESTKLKLDKGHLEGRSRALRHNLLCRRVIEAFGGKVVKTLGDGVLATFPDGLLACRAAVEIKRGTLRLGGLATRAGLAFGHVEEVRVDRTIDVYGDVVDRCARLAALAAPGQLLIDGVLHQAVHAALADYPEVRVGKGRQVTLKGCGPVEVHELSTRTWRFQTEPLDLGGQIRVHEDGRLSLADKVAFLEGARSEVIEFGVGLQTYVSYFLSRRSGEYADHVVALLRRGVRVKCAALDPDFEGASLYCADRGEPEYADAIRAMIPKLDRIRGEVLARAGGGSFELYLYAHLPSFHAVVVDGADERRARMTVSNYLFGIPRSRCPVLQFSKSSSPTLFATYWGSIQRLLDGSRRVL